MSDDIPNFVRLSAVAAFFSFFGAFFLSPVLPIPAGVLFLVAALASLVCFPAALRAAFAGPDRFFRLYLLTVVGYSLFILAYAGFGMVGPEGWGVFLELTLTFTIGLAIYFHHRISAKNLLDSVVRISFLHAGLMLAVVVVQSVFIFKFSGQRVGGAINPIVFAHLMLTSAGIATVWLFLKARTETGYRFSMALALWLAAVFLATYLTGSRGAILVFFPFVAGLAVFDVYLGKRVRLSAMLYFGAIFVLMAVFFMVSDRFALGVSELSESLGGQQNNGSVGLRIQFWQEAIRMIRENPVFGNGLRFFLEISDAPLRNPRLAHNHAHNQFLDIWMKSGIAGVALFVMLHGLPVWAGIRLIASKADIALGMILIWLSGAYLVFGLTDIFITRLGTMTIYGVYMTVLLLLADRRLNAGSGASR